MFDFLIFQILKGIHTSLKRRCFIDPKIGIIFNCIRFVMLCLCKILLKMAMKISIFKRLLLFSFVVGSIRNNVLKIYKNTKVPDGIHCPILCHVNSYALSRLAYERSLFHSLELCIPLRNGR